MAAVVAGAAVRTSKVEASRFQWQVFAVTAIPWVGMMVLHHFTSVLLLGIMVGIRSLFGTHHVGSTAALYADPESRRLMATDPLRFYVAPAAAIVGTAAAFAVLPVSVLELLIVAFGIWSTHHFTRQNFGVFAFTCRARGEDRPSTFERRLIGSTLAVGLLGSIRHGEPFVPLEGIAEPAQVVGALLAVALLAVVAFCARTEPSGARSLGLAMAVLFYLPLYLYPPSLMVTFATFGMAHAAQYYLMMLHLRRGRTRVQSAGFTVSLLVAIGVVGTVLYLGSQLKLDLDWRLAIGAFQGAVLAHFIIDAALWKLSVPERRAFMQERFAFL